jgi:hypothetical protein
VSSRFLPAIIDDKSDVLALSVPLLRSGALSDDRVLAVCTGFRRRGIARFLLSAQAADLKLDMIRSGTAFAAHLQRASGHAIPTSKCEPWFDAVAAADWVTASTIAQHCAPAHMVDLEYEEDFLYMCFLQALATEGADMDALSNMVRRQQVLADDAPPPRLLICQALMGRHADNLTEALEDLIAQRQASYAEGLESDALIEEDWATEGQVFIEGLALLQLAVRLGIRTTESFLFVPDVVLSSPALPADPTAWTRPSDPV